MRLALDGASAVVIDENSARFPSCRKRSMTKVQIRRILIDEASFLRSRSLLLEMLEEIGDNRRRIMLRILSLAGDSFIYAANDRLNLGHACSTQ